MTGKYSAAISAVVFCKSRYLWTALDTFVSPRLKIVSGDLLGDLLRHTRFTIEPHLRLFICSSNLDNHPESLTRRYGYLPILCASRKASFIHRYPIANKESHPSDCVGGLVFRISVAKRHKKTDLGKLDNP